MLKSGRPGWMSLTLLAVSTVALVSCNRSRSAVSELPEDDARLIDAAEFTETPPGPSPATDFSAPEPAPVPRPDSVLYRAELHRATAGGKPGYLLGQLMPEPHRPRGRWEGWTITRVFPGDPGLCAPGCDLYPGDVILTVNGSPLERPEQLAALMESLPELEKLEVRILREGKLHSREYAIVDSPPAG